MISSIELSLTNKTFIRNMTTDSTRQVVTVSLDSDWPATFNCLTLTNKKRTYTRDIEIAVSNDKVVNERVDTTTTLATSNPAPSGMCVISRDCCCQMETGKRCIKNETFVKGKCNAGPDVLYKCETTDYPAKFLKICGGVKGCLSYEPGKSADFCDE